MRVEKLPEDNQLPLNIKQSERHAKGYGSVVWKVLVSDKDAQERLVALKQMHRKEFSSDSEMQNSKRFYDFLKSFPGFGKFVPQTLYFQARMSPDQKPGGYMLQDFSDGKTINSIKDDELYEDPVVVQQLLDFTLAATKIIQETREKKIHKPDFGGTMRSVITSNPRYSPNIIITKKPNKEGQRVFFVDTDIGLGERTNRTMEVTLREVGGRLQQLQLKAWQSKLERILKSKT